MARGKETKFLTELKHSFNEQGCKAIKIGDTPMAGGLRFTTEKEFDMCVNINGLFVGIEGKHLSSFKAFGIREMRDHQIEHLNHVEETNGLAFVFLNVRQKGDKDKGLKYENRLLIFPWHKLKERWEGGSIGKAELLELTYVRGFKQRFDLSYFIEQVKRQR